MQKITPYLWFDDRAEEAAHFDISIFNNSRIICITHFGEKGPGPKGTVMTVTFQLERQDFVALNGGPHFSFSPAISFFVNCETQEEVDELWDKLTEGGEEEQCGRLKNKYGVSWQVIPSGLIEMLQSEDKQKSQRAMEAMLRMGKIDIETIKQAYEHGS